MPKLSADFFASLRPEELDQIEALARSDDPESERKIQEIVSQLIASASGSGVSLDSAGKIVPFDTTLIFNPEPSERQKVLLQGRDGTNGIDEALYGGALMGGKTVGLIHAALQYVHVPRYHAILFRRTSDNLRDVIDRLLDQLVPNHARFVQNIRGGRFIFPSGAMLDMGYMQYEADMMKYKGPEYQALFFDELTEFKETQYTYLFTRLRSATCPHHKDSAFNPSCEQCRTVGLLNKVPLRCYSGSNPDGAGRKWVRERFISSEAMDDLETLQYKDVKKCYEKSGRYFIPSLVDDNPGADAKLYKDQQRARLTPHQQKQLLHGSWKELEGALFSNASFNRYGRADRNFISFLSNGSPFFVAQSPGQAYRFFTSDIAHTSAQKAKESRGHVHSYSVCAAWEYHSQRGPMLTLLDVWRDRVEFLEYCNAVLSMYDQWKPTAVVIEEVVGSKAHIELLRSRGIPVKSFNPMQNRFKGKTGGSPGKLERSQEFRLMCSKGQVYIPENQSPWLDEFLMELTCWTGLESEMADQVDCASMAALEVEEFSPTIIVDSDMSPEILDMPQPSGSPFPWWQFR